MTKETVKQNKSGVLAKLSPLHSGAASACLTNLWSNWNGYSVVETYTDWRQEYDAVRTHVGVRDLSPCIRYEISGADAHAYLNRLATRDISELQIGTRAFTPLCDDQGFVIDLAHVERLSEHTFLLHVSNKIAPWLGDAAFGFDAVEIKDLTGTQAILGLSGIASCTTLLLAGAAGVEKLEPLHRKTYQLKNVSVDIIRTKSLGELSYEVIANTKDALIIWERIVRVGRSLGLKAVGRVAADMCRIEAGRFAVGQDFLGAQQALYGNRPRTPFELGLHGYVDFASNTHFNGRAALTKKSVEAERTSLVGLDVEGEHAVTGASVEQDGRLVGTVTSSIWSPKLKRVIALATLTKAAALQGQEYTLSMPIFRELEPEQLTLRGVIVSPKFYQARTRNARIG